MGGKVGPRENRTGYRAEWSTKVATGVLVGGGQLGNFLNKIADSWGIKTLRSRTSAAEGFDLQLSFKLNNKIHYVSELRHLGTSLTEAEIDRGWGLPFWT